MTRKETPSFEEAFQKLSQAAEALKEESATLEVSLKHFEEGSKYYQQCSRILEKAKQRVMKYDKESGELQPWQ